MPRPTAPTRPVAATRPLAVNRAALPSYYEKRAWTQLWDLTSSDFGWTVSSGTLTVATDPYTGQPALKWSGMDPGATLSDYSLNANLQTSIESMLRGPFRLRVSFNKRVSGIRVVMGMTGFTSTLSRNYVWGSGFSYEGHAGLLTHLDLPPDPVYPTAATWAGTGDITLPIDRVQFQLVGSDTTGLEIYLTDFSYGGRERPKILFGLDNHAGGPGIYDTIYPQMEAQGMQGYLAWSSEVTNPWLNNSFADTKTMIASGWTAINHTTTHPLDAMSYDTAIYEYGSQRAEMLADGFPSEQVTRFAAAPRNIASDGAKQALADLGYASHRVAGMRFLARPTIEINPLETGTIDVSSDISSGSPAMIDYILNAVKLMGTSADIFSHGVSDTFQYYITNADWVYIIGEFTKAKNRGEIDFIAKHDYYDGLTNPRRLVA